MNIQVSQLSALDTRVAGALFRLRHRIFEERLDWQVTSVCGEERDEFDDEYAVYVMSGAEGDELKGCLRLIPSERPYMLQAVFPYLLNGNPAPRAPDVWELSRFAFETTDSRSGRLGFSEKALNLVRGAVEFARLRGIVRYVLVTSVAVERMMLRQGMHCHRLGLPQRIGEVNSIALALEVDATTIRSIGLSAQLGASAISISQALLAAPNDPPRTRRPGRLRRASARIAGRKAARPAGLVRRACQLSTGAQSASDENARHLVKPSTVTVADAHEAWLRGETS